MRKLTFKCIPETDIAVFSEAVLMTLDALDMCYEADETSPPDDNDEVTYKVFGVEVVK